MAKEARMKAKVLIIMGSDSDLPVMEEAAKVLARQMVAAYKEKGELPKEAPALMTSGLTLFGDTTAPDLSTALSDFINAPAGSYLALQAYLPPTAEITAGLARIRARLRERTRLAVTVGYGPRFLHSTGQLHKGDAGRGRFLQFTADIDSDLAIPDQPGEDASALSFGALILAQARGDGQALKQAGRPVLRLHLGKDIPAGLAAILNRI
jgi:glucose-6-phosphate isomerase/transaldolase/glucose-6-phosphate isomerase